MGGSKQQCEVYYPGGRHQGNAPPRSPAGAAAGPLAGLDLTALAPAVQRYFQEGLAPSTWRVYGSAMKKFKTFCLRYNVPDPFPVTEHLLCCFAAFMANEGLAPQSIKSYLSALRNTQLSLGLPDPREQSTLPVLKRVQMGISRASWAVRSPPKSDCPLPGRSSAE